MDITWLVSLIITLIIVGVLFWAAQKIIAVLPLDDTIKQVINVLLVVLLACIIIYWVLLPLIPHGPIRLPVGGR